MSSDASLSEKWSEIQAGICRALMDSDFLEDLQNAKDEDDFERACSELAHDIVVYMGGGDIEPWTVEERRQFQIQILEEDVSHSLQRLEQLRARLNK